MKKRLTEIVSIGGERFKVPKETAKAVLVLLKSKFESEDDIIIANESNTVRSLDERFTSPGACLQGARIKEGLSQVDLAEKLKISQTNLSKMELGKRPIGKIMAKRIASILKVDYRLFL
jgi:ribosome-binding protein aMBF1 (putative translation factor)